MKQLVRLLLTLILGMNLIPAAYAEDIKYEVMSLVDESLMASFEVFSDAEQFMLEHPQTGVFFDHQLIAVNEGLVVLNHQNCSVNIDTLNQKTNEKGYVNGCYGNDGLYLDTDSSGEWILMLQSGARVWVHRDDVTLVPYQKSLQLSSYFVKENELIHQIRTRWNTDEYGSLIHLGPAPEFLDENVIYFSYDGHFFYDDFSLMSRDMKNGTNEYAVNPSDPYYNYFMMLPHRSMTSIMLDELIDYFDSMNVHSKPTVYLDENKDSINDYLTFSQYVDSLDSFYYSQSEFGSNALLMLSLSMNESAAGRSSLAYRRNNLFGHAAYDSDVEKHAKRYLSVESSVISHAKNYISLSYANPDKFMYHGSFFGDKSCGMNVSYASDPYWGEKAAQYAYEIDGWFQHKDHNSEALAIVEDESDFVIYDETLENELASVKNMHLMSFVILLELEDYYLVQIDESLSGFDQQTGSYDFEANTGYLEKSIVDIVLNGENIHQSTYDTIEFRALSGTFSDDSDKKILQFKKGSEYICETPVKENAIFDSWIQVSDLVFEARYREIECIEMFHYPSLMTELNVPVDLSDGSIKVMYKDQSEEIIPLTTSMVSGFSISEAGEQTVTVTYGGSTCTYPLTVSIELDETRNQINALIERVSTYSNEFEYNEQQLQTMLELKDLMQTEFYPVLTMNQITELDRNYATAFSDVWSVILKENTFNLQMTGLHLSKDYDSSLNRRFLKDTIHVEINETASNEFLKETAAAQGWTIEQGFSISMSVNRVDTQWQGPVIFSINRPDDALKSYSVLFLSENDVIQCHTATYKDRIRFKAMQAGEYLLVSKPTVNTYDSIAPEEVYTSMDNGLDVDLLIKSASACLVILLIFSAGFILNLKRRKFRS